jgi:hypothetical protein
VKVAAMETPPKQFYAGSDAVSAVTADLKARLAEVERYQSLSASTDGKF